MRLWSSAYWFVGDFKELEIFSHLVKKRKSNSNEDEYINEPCLRVNKSRRHWSDKDVHSDLVQILLILFDTGVLEVMLFLYGH